MGQLEDMQGKLDTLVTTNANLMSANEALVANVEAGNVKTDSLIVVANTTKEALVALRDQVANGVAVTVADFDSMIAKADAALLSAGVALAAAAAGNAAVDAQDVQTDTAAVEVAP